jgi:hypothetical protein
MWLLGPAHSSSGGVGAWRPCSRCHARRFSACSRRCAIRDQLARSHRSRPGWSAGSIGVTNSRAPAGSAPSAISASSKASSRPGCDPPRGTDRGASRVRSDPLRPVTVSRTHVLEQEGPRTARHIWHRFPGRLATGSGS